MVQDNEIDEIEKNVGVAIKNLRKLKGHTRAELGEILRVSHQQMAKYENGVNRISAGKLYMLSRIMNVSVDYFFSDIAKKSLLPDSGESFVSDREQIEFARNFSLIKSQRKKELVKLLLKAIAEEG